jgi:hypothetical protein
MPIIYIIGIVGRVGRATTRDAMCRRIDPYRQRPRGVAVDFSKQSGWLMNQLGDPSLDILCTIIRIIYYYTNYTNNDNYFVR